MKNERVIADHDSEYHVDNCGFPYWAQRQIKRKLHIIDMREFENLTQIDIIRVHGVGVRLLEKIQTRIHSMGLRLKNE